MEFDRMSLGNLMTRALAIATSDERSDQSGGVKDECNFLRFRLGQISEREPSVWFELLGKIFTWSFNLCVSQLTSMLLHIYSCINFVYVCRGRRPKSQSLPFWSRCVLVLFDAKIEIVTFNLPTSSSFAIKPTKLCTLSLSLQCLHPFVLVNLTVL